MRIAVASFTPGGTTLAGRVVAVLQACGVTDADGRDLAIFDKSREPLKAWVQREFAVSGAVVFIGAAGIAVRMIDGLLRGKDKDPAVLVLDEQGGYVIPLLSGHIGGANRLARELAAALGAQAVITTATDINGVFSVDEWAVANGCAIDDTARIKDVSAALLRGERVGLYSDFSVTGAMPQGMESESGQHAGVCVSLDAAKKPFARTLNVIPRILHLGAGCRKGCDPAAFERFVQETLAGQGLSLKAVQALASIDIKREEPCLLAFAAAHDLDFTVFSAETLRNIPGAFTASSFVRETTGVDNVCERAAMASATLTETGAHLLLAKTARDGMTLALAAVTWRCSFQ